LVNFLKKEHINTSFHDKINCWILSRWKAPWVCTNKNFLVRAPLQIKCISFSKNIAKRLTQKLRELDKILNKNTGILMPVVPTFPLLFITSVFLMEKSR